MAQEQGGEDAAMGAWAGNLEDAKAAPAGPGPAERTAPNLLITGTPGTGKSSHCAALLKLLPGLRHLDVNRLAEERNLYDGFDEQRNVRVLDDDKVCDALEEELRIGGGVVDTHAMVDYFPERWFDLVVVLRTDNTVLYDRLERRGYPPAKITENVQAEIVKVIEQEALGSYDAQLVIVLDSNTVEQLESNVERIAIWAKAWVANNVPAELQQAALDRLANEA